MIIDYKDTNLPDEITATIAGMPDSKGTDLPKTIAADVHHEQKDVSEIKSAEDAAHMNAMEARTRVDRIRTSVEVVWHLIVESYQARDWLALGYGSWDEMCTREFGTSRLRLPREERADTVQSLREAGLSLRAIAAATGYSEPTVRRSLAPASNDAPAPKPQPIYEPSGLDEFTVNRETGEVVIVEDDDDPVLTQADCEALDAARREAEGDLEPTKVIGLDGKKYSRRGRLVEIHGGGRRKRVDSHRIIQSTVTGAETLITPSLMKLVDFSELDGDRLEEWSTSLANSIRSLRKFKAALDTERQARASGGGSD